MGQIKSGIVYQVKLISEKSLINYIAVLVLQSNCKKIKQLSQKAS